VTTTAQLTAKVKDSLFKNPAAGAFMRNAGNIGTRMTDVLPLTISRGPQDQEQPAALPWYL
jgi:hypothetical protein